MLDSAAQYIDSSRSFLTLNFIALQVLLFVIRLLLMGRRLVNSAIIIVWSFGVVVALWLLSRLVVALSRLMVTSFGIETTAIVVHSQRCDEHGDAYLQGHYVYRDLYGREHSFAFKICSDWPGDEQWRKVMQLYTQGAKNRVRYLRWVPALHEIQLSS